MPCSIPLHHFFLPESFPPEGPCLLCHCFASPGSGGPSCPSHVLTTNEVFANLRLEPQRPLELALWEEPVSFHSALPGVADETGAFEGSAGQTGEQGCLRRLALALWGSWPGARLPSASLSPIPAQPPVHHLGLASSRLGAAGSGLELCSLIIHSFNIHVFSTYCAWCCSADMAMNTTDLVLGKRQTRN